jgi:hypothetical protein
MASFNSCSLRQNLRAHNGDQASKHGGGRQPLRRAQDAALKRAKYLSIEVCILSRAASFAALSATSSSLYLCACEAHAVVRWRRPRTSCSEEG